jgi:hypothetical protein
MTSMKIVMERVAGYDWPDEESDAVLDYYLRNSPAELPALPPDPADVPLRFVPRSIGRPPDALPAVTFVGATDLDGDGAPEILVCDAQADEVSVIDGEERTLASVPAPARAEVADVDGDGRLDIVVAVLGKLYPTDGRVGRVVLLRGDGLGNFAPEAILRGVGRVADVRAGDLDGDGDVDLAVAVFGHLTVGEVGWLEQADGRFAYHTLLEKPGAVHVPILDLDGDGRLDIVALVTQDTEAVVALLNRGGGAFEARTLFEAGTPVFGLAALEPVDLDADGDVDFLFTNGDSFDLLNEDYGPVDYWTLVRPHHGVHWLENAGGLGFVHRALHRCYGAYRALPGDFDGDGDLDVIVATQFNLWIDPARQSLVWLENAGGGRFAAHAVGNDPTHLVTATLADLDGDGRPDVVTGGMHAFPPNDRLGRVTWWRNTGGP